MRILIGLLAVSLLALLAPAVPAQEFEEYHPAMLTGDATVTDGPVDLPMLPRWREGGTPYNRDQSLFPQAIHVGRDAPTAGYIESPPEYAPVQGVLFYYYTDDYGWSDVVVDMVAELTKPGFDEIAYVVVYSTYYQSQATSEFTAAGADMSKVQFIIEPMDALWMRDYGPHFIFQDGCLAIVDSHYYPTRPRDNFCPTLLGDDHWAMPTYDMGLYYSGGNFQPGPDRTGFCTALISADNPSSGGFTTAFIGELYGQYQGIDTLHMFPQLPTSVDGTGHIDMWMYIVDDDDVIISEFKAGSNPTAISITNNAVTYMQNLGFTVHRPYAWNSTHPGTGYDTHWTYTNAFRVNDRIFVPRYGRQYSPYLDEDAYAMTQWEAAAGAGVEIVPIDCYNIIWASGAIHCIVMQVPRYTDDAPAAHVISPDGGELLVAGTTHTIEWVATDYHNSVIPTIDLYYSLDGGGTWTHIATTTDTGMYDWLVPDVTSNAALIKVVATAADYDTGEGVSAATFKISPGTQTLYDFSSGAGSDKFGWGHQTSNWNTYIAGHRRPSTASTQISSLQSGAYSKLAHSDATGGDSDSNRYRSPNPSSNYESTHIFEFTIAEDPAEIADVAILWEGYGDYCSQMELYVWDYVSGEWGDGAGLYGQNRFMDNWAGNRDGYVAGHLRSDFERYIDGSGQMTLLVYDERPTVTYSSTYYHPTFHDYMSVVVTTAPPLCAGDMNCDGLVDYDDIDLFVAALSCVGGDPSCWDPACPWLNGDCDGDEDVTYADIDPFVARIGATCP